MSKANMNLIRRMLKEALSFYTYLKNSNKKWVFKSKSGNYPSNYDPESIQRLQSRKMQSKKFLSGLQN